MKIQKLLVLGALGLATLSGASAPVMAKGATTGAHKGNGNGMAKQLGLSKDQKTQLKPIRQSAKAQIRAVKADTGLSKKERKARSKAIRADRNSKMSAILTTEQQQKLATLRAQKRDQKRAAKGKA